MKKQMIDKNKLKKLYLDKNMSQRDISKKLVIPRRSVRYYLDKYKIIKSKGESVKNLKDMTIKELEDLKKEINYILIFRPREDRK